MEEENRELREGLARLVAQFPQAAEAPSKPASDPVMSTPVMVPR